MKRFTLLAALLLATLPLFLSAEEPPPCPLHAAHAESGTAAELDHRGDQVMGFDHTRTTHHFRVESDGGVVEVEATSPEDDESRQAIRSHLHEIAGMFTRGDFTSPFTIHQRVLPGVPVMIEKKDAIRYLYEETERGARIRISSSDSSAVSAVHEFLQAQIGDHRTGDPVHAHP
jgi:hypothetical protein